MAQSQIHYFFCIPELESIDFVTYDELNEIRDMDIKTFTLDDLLQIEYLKGKKVGSLDNLKEKVFAFADEVESEYQRLIF